MRWRIGSEQRKKCVCYPEVLSRGIKGGATVNGANARNRLRVGVLDDSCHRLGRRSRRGRGWECRWTFIVGDGCSNERTRLEENWHRGQQCVRMDRGKQHCMKHRLVPLFIFRFEYGSNFVLGIPSALQFPRSATFVQCSLGVALRSGTRYHCGTTKKGETTNTTPDKLVPTGYRWPTMCALVPHGCCGNKVSRLWGCILKGKGRHSCQMFFRALHRCFQRRVRSQWLLQCLRRVRSFQFYVVSWEHGLFLDSFRFPTVCPETYSVRRVWPNQSDRSRSAEYNSFLNLPLPPTLVCLALVGHSQCASPNRIRLFHSIY